MIAMRSGQLLLCVAAAIALELAALRTVGAADSFRKLKDAEIKARLAGMEVTDGVHWAEQYMRDGTYRAFHMGKPTEGKWFVRGGELCLDDGKAEPNCREVWMSGSKVEFRGTALEGVLQKQQKRG
jgi:hypothetical protein